MSLAAPFDVCGELPSGTVLLEASAGTGKTFTIAALATRLVAEGACRLDELLLVTFGRAATRELRERVRERLVHTAAALRDPLTARASSDSVVALLAAVSDPEVERRQRRLQAALADFDAATIDTTHAFCLQVLTSLGTAADMEPGLTFVDPFQALLDDLVDDLYLQRFAIAQPPPALDYALARDLAAAVIADPQAAVVPGPEEEGEVGARSEWAHAVRRALDQRKRQQRVYGYDDLPTRLLAALRDEVTGPIARARLQARYRYVLVDEFQDTDPVQWEILHRAFYGAVSLVLIGDPKQAIYAFRGGDIEAYLTAAQVVQSAADAGSGRHATLARNWRSDGGLVHGVRHLFRGAALGDPAIAVRPIDAEHRRRIRRGERPARDQDAAAEAAVQLRVVPGTVGGTAPGSSPPVAVVRDVICRDLANDVVRHLTDGTAIADGASWRPLCPADIAVLTRTQAQSELVREALVQAGVPSVLTSVRSVFDSSAAQDWLALLRVLEQPHRSGPIRALALTDLVGWDAAELDAADDTRLDELAQRVLRWRDALGHRGVSALLEALTADGVAVRMLGHPDGERRLTDFRHVGQTLHEVQVTEGLGAAALAEWLQRRIAEAAGDQAEERSRRLDTDAQAVQIITMHVSKGLEFPIVYVPFAWDRYDGRTNEALLLHEAGRRVRDVGGRQGRDYAAHAAQAKQEDLDEELRLLYVALTRAKHRVVAWWAPSRNTRTSPLHRVLFGDFTPGEVPPNEPRLPKDPAAQLADFAAEAGAEDGAPRVGVVVVDEHVEPPQWQGHDSQPTSDSLEAEVFDRQVDLGWRRMSYTSLTAAAHGAFGAGAATRAPGAIAGAEPGVASEPEVSQLTDEPSPRDDVRRLANAWHPGAATGGAVEPREQWRSVLSPMRDLPTGAAFGVVVHEVLETVDTAAPDLRTAVIETSQQALHHRPMPGVGAEDLGVALLPALATPLGSVGLGRTLAEVAPRDRLAEVDFELPLAGGDDPAERRVTLAAVAAAMRAHLPNDDPLAGYPDALSSAGLDGQLLRGYLTGSIDAVLRLADSAGQPRYVVVDYKTNWLGGFGDGAAPLSAWDYRNEALAQAMIDSHYPLQALLYSVALHRYLRWRQPGYDPEVHLGGVLYLFVRGMCGPFEGANAAAGTLAISGGADVPGVFEWRPPASLVTSLSDLVDGRLP
ncbi:MAG: UvrD-helicase domain-containing protein [Actinomycetales bacterium]